MEFLQVHRISLQLAETYRRFTMNSSLVYYGQLINQSISVILFCGCVLDLALTYHACNSMYL